MDCLDERNYRPGPLRGRPGQSHFTAVIYGMDRAKFGNPETTLRGKRIRVTGPITYFRGKPEIVLTEPSELTQ
jgi:hypothetical protein